MSERGSADTSERDQMSEIIFMFLGFTFAIGAHLISAEVAGFSPLWFPRGKLFVSLVSCDYSLLYHYHLSNMILESYLREYNMHRNKHKR